MYRLVVKQGGEEPVAFLLKPGTYSLGRRADNDIVLTDASVSRSHCLLYVRADYVEIEDLGSANGVRVDGQRVSGRVEIKAGQEFSIGDAVALLEMEEEAAGVTRLFNREDLEG